MMMKLAVVGKGGAGKTVLSSLLARSLADRGLRVLAVDLDSNPGLAVSLGVNASDTPLPGEAVEERAGTPYGWALARDLSAAEAVRRYAVPAGHNVVFLGFGNRGGLRTPITQYLTAVRQVVEEFDEAGWVVVADLAAGPTTPFEGYTSFASLALVAVEANPTSMLTARALLGVLAHEGTRAELVVTKAGSEEHVRTVIGDFGVVPLACIPFDDEVRRLERRGSLADLPDHSPALQATTDLVGKLGF
jgi:CO dehydrogenase maturation factor